MKNFLYSFFAAMIVLSGLTSCYRMPCEDDYCLIPATNNPTITRQADPGINGVNY